MNAFSKKWENHSAMMALFFAYYNYCRPQQTLTEDAGWELTPTMAAGLAGYPWTLGELLAQSAALSFEDSP